MSSIVKHKIAITNANQDMLNEAVKMLMQNDCGIKFRIHQGEVTDWYGNVVKTPQNCMRLQFNSHRFPIGIYVENGTIIITGDFHGAWEEEKEIQRLVQQMYQAVATRFSLMKMGFRTQVKVEGKLVKVQGVC